MKLASCTLSDLRKWYEGFDGMDTSSVRWKVYLSLKKRNTKRKYLPKKLVETLEFLSKEDKVNIDTLGLYNPNTDTIEPLDINQWNKIFARPNFTQVVLHHYNVKLEYDGYVSVGEETFYTLNGNLYNETMLHKFQALYRYDFINHTLYSNIIENLKKDYYINYDTWTKSSLPIIFINRIGYYDDDSQYNIHLDPVFNTLIEGIGLSRKNDAYRPNTDLKYIETLNDKLFDGNKETYKYFKSMPPRNILELECMYERTDYELERMTYLLEHDSDYSCLDACKIDFTAYERNVQSIRKYLDDIDARFYKLSGKHILKKVKELN